MIIYTHPVADNLKTRQFAYMYMYKYAHTHVHNHMQDYPSVGQIIQMLQQNEVAMIFAVQQERLATYQVQCRYHKATNFCMRFVYANYMYASQVKAA